MKGIFTNIIKKIILISALTILNANCIYFAIYKDSPKCIFEEYYKGTVNNFFIFFINKLL